MSINDQHLSHVLNYLNSKSIRMSRSNEWLAGCCTYYTQMDSQVNLTNLCKFVYEQWLLADLRDISEPCLPSIANDLKVTTIRGEYSLQVDAIVDVSESYYSQLEKLKRARSRNGAILAMEIDDEQTQEEKIKTPAWQKKKIRTLKLICTDGVNTVFAMEYEPIAELQEPFVPGLKILIKGPIECRRGIFLLKRNNLRILGGESDSVIPENSLENILTTELNRQRTNEPIADSVSEFQSIVREFDRDDSPVPISRNEASTAVTVENRVPLNRHRANEGRVDSRSQFQSMVREFDREDSPVRILRNETSTATIADSRIPVVGIACPIVTKSHSNPLPPNRIETNFNLQRTENDNMSIDSNDSNFNGNRRSIDALVKKLTSKPRIKNERWQLSTEIEQTNGTIMEVSFADTVIEELFGFSAVEVEAQKEQIKQNPSVKERIDKIIKGGVTKILSLRGKFDLKMSSDNTQPVVMGVIPIKG